MGLALFAQSELVHFLYSVTSVCSLINQGVSILILQLVHKF